MRVEFLNTTASRALGVEGRSIPVPLVPSMAALARTCRYFETEVNELQPMERSVSLLWEALIRAGAKPTVHQVAMLVDGTSLSEENRVRFGGDYVLHSEPGDPHLTVADDDSDDAAEEEDGVNLPTGPAADDAAGDAQETSPLDEPRRAIS